MSTAVDISAMGLKGLIYKLPRSVTYNKWAVKAVCTNTDTILVYRDVCKSALKHDWRAGVHYNSRGIFYQTKTGAYKVI